MAAPTVDRPWWRRHLRLEDVLLAGWMIVVAPLFAAGSGSSPTTAGSDPILGLLDLVGLLTFAACIGARSRPGVASGLVERGDLRYAVGPLVGAFAFAVNDVRDRLGLPDAIAAFPIVAAAAVALISRLRLPPLSAIQRRTLVTPFVLVASRYFGQVLGGLTSIFDLRELASSIGQPGGIAGAAFVVVVAIVGVAIFYVMLVFAPRQIAEREGTGATWTVRFVLFIVSLALGQTIAGLAHPS